MVEICQRAEKTEAAAKEEPGRLKKFGNLLLEGIRGLGTGTRKLLVYGAVATTLGLTACPKPSEQPDGHVSDGDSDVDSDTDSDVDSDGDMDSDIDAELDVDAEGDMEHTGDAEPDIDEDDDAGPIDSMECVETTECSPEIDPNTCNTEDPIVEGWVGIGEPLCSDNLPVRFELTAYDDLGDGNYRIMVVITDECGVQLTEPERLIGNPQRIGVGDEHYLLYPGEGDPEGRRKRMGVKLDCFGGSMCCISHGLIEHGEGFPSTRLGFDNVYITIDTVDETGDRHIALLEVYNRTTDALITRLRLGNTGNIIFEDVDHNRYMLDGSFIGMDEMAGIPVARATLDVYASHRSGCDCRCSCAE
ncbi:MAG: hypothetical protein ABII39_06225 [Candidatus Micrarchaeota archaeon]